MRVIGKFKEIYHNDKFPSIFDSMLNEEYENKKKILEYLRKGKVTAASPAVIHDVVTDKRLDIPLNFMEDEKYAWRSDLIYYVEKYNIRLDDDFIEHVLSKIK